MRLKYSLCLISVILAVFLLIGCTGEIPVETHSAIVPSTIEPSFPVPTESIEPTASNATNLYETPVASQMHLDYLQDYAYVGSGFGIPLDEFILIFGENCVRNIDGHPYAVLQKHDGTKLFVFFDWNSENCLIQEVAPFVTKQEFENFISDEQITMDRINAYNRNYIGLQSSRPFGAYYVDEGAFLIVFTWEGFGETRKTFIEYVEFIPSNELQNSEACDGLWLWRILPEDMHFG